MTLAERAAHYSVVFPDRPPMHAGDRWLEGTWIGGNNYRGSGYYGAYPPDYLERVRALFPDKIGGRVLHLFSGSLEQDAVVPGVRVDIKPEIVIETRTGTRVVRPDVVADARRLPFVAGWFDLILADTPYGPRHAKRYGVAMPDRKVVTREAARVLTPGGFLVWLDTKLPMFRKDLLHWCGVIPVIRSTNHDYRGAAIFQRERAA